MTGWRAACGGASESRPTATEAWSPWSTNGSSARFLAGVAWSGDRDAGKALTCGGTGFRRAGCRGGASTPRTPHGGAAHPDAPPGVDRDRRGEEPQLRAGVRDAKREATVLVCIGPRHAVRATAGVALENHG